MAAPLEWAVLLPDCPTVDLKEVADGALAPQEKQLAIFCCLATNSCPRSPLTLEGLDAHMQIEPTFFTCRAIRRLLLGERLHPFIHKECSVFGKVGQRYKGPGLIMSGKVEFTPGQVDTNRYLPAVTSWELTDEGTQPHTHRGLRSIYCTALLSGDINYPTMFRLVCRYLQFWDFDQCVQSFVMLLPLHLRTRCQRNYFALLDSLTHLSLSLLPVPSPDIHLKFLRFNINSFTHTWGDHGELSTLRLAVAHNTERLPAVLKNLSKQSRHQEINVSDTRLVKFQTTLNQLVPRLHVKIVRKDPGPKTYKVVVCAPEGTYYIIYPTVPAIYRLVMCMSVAQSLGHSRDHAYPGANFLRVDERPRLLAAMLSRIRYAPKDRKENMRGNPGPYTFEHQAGMPRTTDSQLTLEMFDPTKHVSLENFKITIFNTNMVINTKMHCYPTHAPSPTILNVPRLTNNFVIRKYSVKEPSFTISVFFSETLCQVTAININISGDLMHFFFAMGTLKCFLPIKHIFPVSIANWNSTLDLHGLENQSVVRMGRRDVFWTTNFPSVVSSKEGLNVSWFKAATATVSKVYGQQLVNQLQCELLPILTNPQARIDFTKNRIFSLLETRNRSQIQTLHKRFLECLVESCSFLRLDVSCIRRAVAEGVFDFSKKIISHTKSKHECAILGYKKCNLIPKIYIHGKKSRLDELGRNANFTSFVATTGYLHLSLKPRILRHVFRRQGLRWREGWLRSPTTTDRETSKRSRRKARLATDIA
ncbi:virion UL87 [Colobine gammaherpesvirus 1]|uniref:Virion UL87 n=1 Tax=Colobine gammaherpesvirus 1 TaxID=2597325 RepID=A0A5B8FKF8_9GAMA|nr:virion UL87 [Colobine gammaherpesvirus 1]QDQ69232.1 virion UL87 [Colobine gammaherpesvirus 1]